MPIPLILWGAAAALAATGVVKGVQASNDFDKAKEIGEDAERRHKKAISSLEKTKKQTHQALEQLGEMKVHTFTHQIKWLVDAIKRTKHASSRITGFDESFTVEELKEYQTLILGSLEIEKGLGSGALGGALAAMGAYGTVGTLATASTGAAISGLSGAAATNATLAWLGGGALSAGGFGMAGGMIALGGIVLGPALAIGGFMMASKAEEALSQAYDYDAKVDVAVAEIKTVQVGLNAIQENASEMSNIIAQLTHRFEQVKVYDDSNQEHFAMMVSIGKSLKMILDAPIINPDGTAVKNIKGKYYGVLEV